MGHRATFTTRDEASRAHRPGLSLLLALGLALGATFPAAAHSDRGRDRAGAARSATRAAGPVAKSFHGHGGDRDASGRSGFGVGLRPLAWQAPWHGRRAPRFGWHGGHPRHHDHDAWCELITRRDEETQGAFGRELDRLRLVFGCPPPDVDPDPGSDPDPQPDPEPTIEVAGPPMATLVDGSGVPFADVGHVDVDDLLIEVPAASGFPDPIVILGPATQREPDAGVARIEAIDAGGFQVRFEEWGGLDGLHGDETVSYLMLAPGRYLMADGSEWEVGALDVDGTNAFVAQAFTSAFARSPALFLTVQGRTDDDPVVVRARQVTPSGFQAALQEAEGADGVHGAERVGYLAIASPTGSGVLAAASDSLPYWMTEAAVGDAFVPILSGALALEEETSLDDETTHVDETVAFLALGPLVFAQVMSDAELDPIALRRRMPEHGADLEWGTVSGIDDNWHTVPLARRYVDPIVVVGPASRNGGHAGFARVRDVGADAFSLRFQEWAYLDGFHASGERVFYLVAERGVQALGGLMLEASSLESGTNVRDGLDDVALTLPFPEVPGVFASVSTVNDPAPVVVRMTGRSTSGFRLGLQAEEASSVRHGVERIDWIAIQPGEGVTPDGRTLRVFETSVGGGMTSVPLGTGLRGRFPTLLAQVATLLGGDPVAMRFMNLGPDQVELQTQEEQSFDAETGHTNEAVAVFVAE
ncbi:MAG: hypothetical protein R3F35_07045 [Myxococcota bacterium]